MKVEYNKRYFTIAVYSFGVIAASILLFILISQVDGIKAICHTVYTSILPVLLGFGVAYLINPMVRWIEKKPVAFLFKKTKSPKKPRIMRAVSMLFSYIFTLALITLFLFIVIPEVGASLKGLITTQLPLYIEQIEQFISRFIESVSDNKALVAQLEAALESSLTALNKSLNSLVPYLAGLTLDVTVFIKNLILAVIISIYLLFTKETMCAQCKKACYALFPTRFTDRVIDILKDANRTFGGFISGKILDSIIIGLLCFIGMTILRLPYAVLISVTVGITNVIPYFGPFIGAIPSGILILFIDPMKALIFAIFILVLQQFDGNILGPKILGETTGLTAFWVIFAILLFGGLFNVLGMFLGVPIFAVIYSLIRAFINMRLQKKALPTATADYVGKGHITPAVSCAASDEGFAPDAGASCDADSRVPVSSDKAGETAEDSAE